MADDGECTERIERTLEELSIRGGRNGCTINTSIGAIIASVYSVMEKDPSVSSISELQRDIPMATRAVCRLRIWSPT